MRPVHRWALVAATCALVIGVPYAVRARPVADPGVGAADLVGRVRAASGTAYSGTVDVEGRLGLPIADHFTDLADLFGGESRLRVWWRGDDDWRVDRLLATGEVDLFHHANRTVSWDYERQEARTDVDPRVRLPRDSDLLPPQIATRALDGAPASAVTRLPARRVAGVAAAGLRVSMTDPRSSIDHVDLWVDPDTGLTLSVEVYGTTPHPVLSAEFTTLTLATPDPETTRFRPVPGVHPIYDSVLDIADAADQFAPVRPPAEVAGFARSSGASGAAGIYGTGLTRLLALPLPDHEAADLAGQLKVSGATKVDGRELLRVGPLGVTLTSTNLHDGTRWLLAGSVTDDTLARAAEDVTAGTSPR